jgi:hypothetical protein
MEKKDGSKLQIFGSAAFLMDQTDYFKTHSLFLAFHHKNLAQSRHHHSFIKK